MVEVYTPITTGKPLSRNKGDTGGNSALLLRAISNWYLKDKIMFYIHTILLEFPQSLHAAVFHFGVGVKPLLTAS